jgi:hypothetical protein
VQADHTASVVVGEDNIRRRRCEIILAGSGALNDDFGTIGFLIIGIFVLNWIATAIIYRARGYNQLVPTILGPRAVIQALDEDGSLCDCDRAHD